MKKWPGLILVLLLVFSAVFPISASPARVLSKESLDKFLGDYPLIQAEIEELEAELSEEFSGFQPDEDGYQSEDNNFQYDDEDFQLEDDGFPTPESIVAGVMAVMANPRVDAILTRHGWTEAFIETYVTVLTGYSYLAFQELFLAYPLPELKAVLDQLEPGLHPDDLELLREYRARIELVLDLDAGV